MLIRTYNDGFKCLHQKACFESLHSQFNRNINLNLETRGKFSSIASQACLEPRVDYPSGSREWDFQF